MSRNEPRMARRATVGQKPATTSWTDSKGLDRHGALHPPPAFHGGSSRPSAYQVYSDSTQLARDIFFGTSSSESGVSIQNPAQIIEDFIRSVQRPVRRRSSDPALLVLSPSPYDPRQFHRHRGWFDSRQQRPLNIRWPRLSVRVRSLTLSILKPVR